MGKTVKLTIRLSPEDMALLKSRTAKTRLSQSGYLRMLIRGYVPKAYPPGIYFEVLQKLNRASGTVTDPVIYRELLGALRTLQEAVTVPAKIEDMEGFWGILKRERYYGRKFTSREQLDRMIREYIAYYNFSRLQRRLGVHTPMEVFIQYRAA